jgi:hypothetical protein
MTCRNSLLEKAQSRAGYGANLVRESMEAELGCNPDPLPNLALWKSGNLKS